MRPYIRVATAAWLLCSAAASADPLHSRGEIETVTVYRGQALVTRGVEIPAGGADVATGLREVVVTDLPTRVIASSLHAEAEGGVQVRSVRFRARPVAVENREEVRKLDERFAALQEQLETNKRHHELLAEQRAYLKSLEGFVAPTASTELTKGVLNAETLERLSAFLMKSRQEVATRELELAAEARKLSTEAELIQRERQTLTVGSSTTVNEAVVVVSGADAKGAGGRGAEGKLRLRYLVEDATWTPSYNVRAGGADDDRRVVLEYFASIQQMSGEDWSNVSMTLSTATPSLVSRAPTLEAMKIGFGSAELQSQVAQGQYKEARDQLSKKQKEAEQVWQNRAFKGEAKDQLSYAQADLGNILSLNSLACEIQILDLMAGERVQRNGARQRMPVDENLSVTYTIAGTTSLPSRNDRQLVQIASMPMKAEFAKIGVPVLTGQVYDEATATNEGRMVLLAGPVTAYRDGAFVGSGELPTTAAGQAFTVGFGIDSSLSTGRELIERTETTMGGNRVVEMTYRLTIENFGSEPAAVRLLDRIPKADASDIQVRLVSASPELSSSGDYEKKKDDGILRWDVTVPAQAIGSKAFSVEYRFRLEYDKQRMLAGGGL